jgi:hypothetical protein
VNADLTMTGTDTGSLHEHLVFSGLRTTPAVTVTGNSTATYDGTTLSGIPAAPQAWPDALPRPSHLHLSAALSGRDHRHVVVRVMATVAGAGADEAELDTRAVTDATVTIGSVTAHTDSSGTVSMVIPPGGDRPVTVRATAGDTLVPADAVLDAQARAVSRN